MTHDQVTDALVGAASGADVPEAARRHAETCAECGDLARALAVLAAAPDAAAPPPPAGYWDGFDARLAARLRRERAAPWPRGGTWTRALGRLAAALVLVLAGWAAVRGVRDAGPDADELDALSLAADQAALSVAAAASPAALVEEAEALAGAWSRSWPQDVADTAGAWSLALTSDADGWTDPFADPLAPVDSVGEELTGRLSEEQAAELARRLREELSS